MTILKRSIERYLQMLSLLTLDKKSQNGLGDAILHARHLINDEAFAVLLADDLILNNPSCTEQLIEAYQKTSSTVIGLNNVPEEETNKYGVISSDDIDSSLKYFSVKRYR